MSVVSSDCCYCRTGYGVLVEVGDIPGAPGVPPRLVNRTWALKRLGGMRGLLMAGAHRVPGAPAKWLATVRKVTA